MLAMMMCSFLGLLPAAAAAAAAAPAGPYLTNPCLDSEKFKQAKFCDPTLGIDERAADIVSRLSIVEKIDALGTNTGASLCLFCSAAALLLLLLLLRLRLAHCVPRPLVIPPVFQTRFPAWPRHTRCVAVRGAGSLQLVVRSHTRYFPRSRWPEKHNSVRDQLCPANHHGQFVQPVHVEGHWPRHWHRSEGVYERRQCVFDVLGASDQFGAS
jgi:hypothetical protein